MNVRRAIIVVGLMVLSCQGGCNKSRPDQGSRAEGSVSKDAGLKSSELPGIPAGFGTGLPVAVRANDAGVMLFAADGTRTLRIIASPVTWAVLDSRADVLWFGTPGDRAEIHAADLRGDEPVVVTVVRDCPADVLGGVLYLSPDGTPLELLASRAAAYDGYVEMQIGAKEPVLKYVPGALALVSEGGDVEVSIRRAAFTREGLDFIKTLVQRRGNLRPADSRLDLPRVKSVPASACEDPEMCGTAEEIPAAGLWRVAVGHSCGDACYVDYQLYDPAASEFVDPARPGIRSRSPLPVGDSLNELFVSADGVWFMADGKIFQKGKGKVADIGDGAVGWLGGGTHLR